MVEFAEFPPLLRTGKMPLRAALRAATGKEPEEIARLPGETDDVDETPEPNPVELRFRDAYHRLVAAMLADWREDHPQAGADIGRGSTRIPTATTRPPTDPAPPQETTLPAGGTALAPAPSMATGCCPRKGTRWSTG